MLTYAGVLLSVSTPKLSLAIERAISPRDLLDFQRLDWPGPDCLSWTFPGRTKHRHIEIGKLYWPRDASRWAVGYFLATDNQLEQIRNAMGSQYRALPLLLSWEDQDGDTVASIAPLMWMLPPRPLFQIPEANGMWLCTFVDDRYWWWLRDTGDVTVTAGTTTWQQLYTSLASSLGITLANDAINAAYLTPASVLTARYERSPLMLDAVAYNVGQRIVRDWDTGNVFAYGPTTSATIFNNNFIDDWPLMGGGDFALNPDLPNDLPTLLPGTVCVTFPWSTSDAEPPDVFAQTVTLSSLNLADLGTKANANTKTFHDTALAIGGSGTPANAAALAALVRQIATDWYRQQVTPSELKFVGIVPWEVEGLSDAIEWTYRKGEVSTRIYRPPWNDLAEELCHGPDGAAMWAYLVQTNVNDQDPVSPVPAGFPGFIGLSGRVVNDAHMSSGSNLLNSSTANFTSGDIGMLVLGFGVANCQGNATDPNPLASTPTFISSINSSTQAVMTANATANVTNGTVGIATNWCLATQMNISHFDPKTVDGPGVPWPDFSLLSSSWMVAERDGGLNHDEVTLINNTLITGYNEIVNGILPVCNRIYRGKLVGVDIFGVSIYEARVEPMQWWWAVDPSTTTTSTITLTGTGASVTAFSAEIYQVHGSPGFFQNTSAPGTLGKGFWISGDPRGTAAPPPSTIIQSRQIDCDSATGLPVFSGYGKLSYTPSSTGSFNLPSATYQYTGISLTLSEPGTYLVMVIVPGSVAGQLNHGEQLSLEVGLKLDGVDYGTHCTVASIANPGVTWTTSDAVYGTVMIPALVSVTTSSHTFQLWAGVYGNTASLAGAQVGTNLSTLGEVIMQASRTGI